MLHFPSQCCEQVYEDCSDMYSHPATTAHVGAVNDSGLEQIHALVVGEGNVDRLAERDVPLTLNGKDMMALFDWFAYLTTFTFMFPYIVASSSLALLPWNTAWLESIPCSMTSILIFAPLIWPGASSLKTTLMMQWFFFFPSRSASASALPVWTTGLKRGN
jgi:hypothetical protein